MTTEKKSEFLSRKEINCCNYCVFFFPLRVWGFHSAGGCGLCWFDLNDRKWFYDNPCEKFKFSIRPGYGIYTEKEFTEFFDNNEKVLQASEFFEEVAYKKLGMIDAEVKKILNNDD